MTVSASAKNYPFYIDSHCHFDFAQFDEGRQRIWQSCARHNICQLIIPGVTPAQWQKAKDVCENFDGIFCAAGLHPWWVSDYINNAGSIEQASKNLIAELGAWINTEGCLAVGECGMDKTIDAPLPLQQMFFTQQLRFAKQARLPLIVHSLKTHNEILKTIKDEAFSAGGVIHAFSGSREIANAFVEAGFYLGVGGTITYERSKKTRDAIAHIPLNRILLETDAPDMPLSGNQGKPNSPLCIPQVAKVLAQLRSEDAEEIMSRTSQNAVELFNLDAGNRNQCESVS